MAQPRSTEYSEKLFPSLFEYGGALMGQCSQLSFFQSKVLTALDTLRKQVMSESEIKNNIYQYM